MLFRSRATVRAIAAPTSTFRDCIDKLLLGVAEEGRNFDASGVSLDGALFGVFLVDGYLLGSMCCLRIMRSFSGVLANACNATSR